MVYGIGINDMDGMSASYEYSIWQHVLRGVIKYDCSMCEEWKVFSNFLDWFYANYFDGSEMYKVNGHYSPETCQFLPKDLVNLLCMKRGKGYTVDSKSKYVVRFKKYGKLTYVGVRDTEEEAKELAKVSIDAYVSKIILDSGYKVLRHNE